MRFRMLSLIILVFSCFVASELQAVPQQGIWPTIKQKLYSACHVAKRSAQYCALVVKNLALKSIGWAWRKKKDIAVATALQMGAEAVNKYWVSPPEQMQTRKEPIWKKSGSAFMRAANCGAIGLSRAKYVKYIDVWGDVCRCYAEKEPEKFEELIEQVEKEHVDTKVLFRTVSEEASLTLLQNAAIKILSDTVTLPNIPGPLLFKCFVRGFCYVAAREAIRHNFVHPCMNFGAHARQDGLSNAFRSLWHRESPASAIHPIV